MNKKEITIIIPIIVVLITIFSIRQWGRLPIGNTFLVWFFDFILLGFILWYRYKFFKPLNRKDYLIVTIYFIWMSFGVVRGAFTAGNYWEWKQWANGSLILSLPVFLFLFESPFWLRKVMNVWLKYALPLFFFFGFFIKVEVFQAYLGPVLLLSCFLPIIPRFYRYLFLGLLLLMVFVSLDARSQVIKAVFALMMSGAVLLSKYYSQGALRLIHWSLYAAAAVLLFLGISGHFNLFVEMANNQGQFVQKNVVNGHTVDDDLSVDTRTFIYVEVIHSAIEHGYTLWGRTPARGNDSVAFGAFTAEQLKTGKYERFANEVVFPNVFTWLGLIGVILYCLIYLKSSYLAIYKSNSLFLKLIGVFIAFHFAYGWVEDVNNFDILNISLWAAIAMGFSERFRRMENKEFREWFFELFPKV